MASQVRFPITNDEAANDFLVENPLALILGMLLDQQVPMEWAFRSPHTLAQRLGDRFNATDIAAMDPEDLVAVFCEKPALHRYPAAMARRAHAVCEHVVDNYRGDPARIWFRATDGAELYRRVGEIPGFGEEKAKIFVALLAKQLGVKPAGWTTVTGDYGKKGFRSVADVTDPDSLQKVRDFKKAAKAAAKAATS